MRELISRSFEAGGGGSQPLPQASDPCVAGFSAGLSPPVSWQGTCGFGQTGLPLWKQPLQPPSPAVWMSSLSRPRCVLIFGHKQT